MATYEDRTRALIGEEDHSDLERFSWQVTGYEHHPGSSDEWRLVIHDGEIEAEHPAMALVKLATGFGPGTTDENTIDWTVIDGEHEVTVALRPLERDKDA